MGFELFEVHSDERYFEFSPPKIKGLETLGALLSVKLNSSLRSTQALDQSLLLLLANWEVEVYSNSGSAKNGAGGINSLSELLLKKVLTEMKSSQVFPCECFRHGYNSERGWLLLVGSSQP